MLLIKELFALVWRALRAVLMRHGAALALAAAVVGAGCVGGAPAPEAPQLHGSAPLLAAARAAQGLDAPPAAEPKGPAPAPSPAAGASAAVPAVPGAPGAAASGSPVSGPASAAAGDTLTHSHGYAVRWLRPLAGRAEGDGVAVLHEGGLMRLVVTSSGGTGAAELRPERGVWPRVVQLQFQYAEGRPFDELQGLRVQVSAWAHQAGDEVAGAPPDGFVVWQRDGALRVALPAGWLQQRDTLRIAWVDRYRR